MKLNHTFSPFCSFSSTYPFYPFYLLGFLINTTQSQYLSKASLCVTIILVQSLNYFNV